MTDLTESDQPLSTGVDKPCCHPSAELLARAQCGWDTFLARTGPLPGEDIEHGRYDESAER
ncbi:hypothetical protein [Streptomyces sp. NPDC092952]|uniref:hypothetical protein n=1 Tax=Streptomyces sp. NPDC092952 TaxID=3366018 RepID=UPI00381D7C18